MPLFSLEIADSSGDLDPAAVWVGDDLLPSVIQPRFPRVSVTPGLASPWTGEIVIRARVGGVLAPLDAALPGAPDYAFRWTWEKRGTPWGTYGALVPTTAKSSEVTVRFCERNVGIWIARARLVNIAGGDDKPGSVALPFAVESILVS